MSIKVLNEDFLIGRPRRTSHKHLWSILHKRLYHRQLLGSILNLQHTIETGIAHYGCVCNTYLGKQFLADFVLHKEVCEAVEHTAILTTIPLEEHLVLAEYARHTINRNVTMLQYVQIVVPELVFDKERHNRADCAQESAGIGNCV